MKALDVYYLDFKDTTCITVPSLKFKVGQKISDDQGNIFEIKGLSTFSGLTARRDVSNLIVQGKFEGNTVTFQPSYAYPFALSLSSIWLPFLSSFLVIKKHRFPDAKVKLLCFLRIFLELVIE